MNQTSCTAAFCVLGLTFAAKPILLCQVLPATSKDASRKQVQTTPAGIHALSADEQSCKEFVQKFYDWYWNRFADEANNLKFDLRKEPNDWTVVKHKRSVLSPALYRLLADDEKQMRRTHELGSLDFDPFLNIQDPLGKYEVGRVGTTGNRCNAAIPQGHLVAELEKRGSSWVFANFHYSFYSEDGKSKEFPDEDLVQILSRKH